MGRSKGIEKVLSEYCGLMETSKNGGRERLFDEEGFDGTHGVDAVHDCGKFHEIFGQANVQLSFHEYLDGLLAHTMHKSESYAAPSRVWMNGNIEF